MPDPRMCLDKTLTPREQAEAAVLAVREAAFNAPDPAALADVTQALSHPEAAVLLTGKRWAVGRTIKIQFLNGDPTIIAKVKQVVAEWMEYANLKFVYVNSGGEIRINFDASGGSWSYIGTDSLTIPKDRPTMNFGWFTSSTDITEIRRTAVHEFGHMAGLGHEHSSPVASIPWDKEAAYAYYQRTQGWSRSQVDAQVFQRYSTPQTQFTAFDRDSIMEYPVDDSLTIGNFSIPLNTDLSAMDKKFVSEVYPLPKPPADGTLQKLRQAKRRIVGRIQTRTKASAADRGRLKKVNEQIKAILGGK